jgi:hypothetical protein
LTANHLSEFTERFIHAPGAAAFITGLAGMALCQALIAQPSAGVRGQSTATSHKIVRRQGVAS